MSWYYLSLENGREYISVEGEFSSERKAGECIIAFCDVDWAALYQECEALREYKEGRDTSLAFADFYLKIRECGTRHPLLEGFFNCQLIKNMVDILYKKELGTDTPQWRYVMALERGRRPESIPQEEPREFFLLLSKLLFSFTDFQKKLVPMIDTVLNAGGEHAELAALQRYSLFRRKSIDYPFLAKKLYSTMSYEYRVYEDGVFEDFSPQCFGPAEITKNIKECRSELHPFQATDFLEALLLWEFDYMAANGLVVRRCDHCGRFFLPFSVASRYCERPLAEREDKTCKDVGASIKHQREVNSNAASALYKKVNNRVQTAATRLEKIYPNIRCISYKRWQLAAKQRLERVKSGELDYETFAAEIDRSPREMLGEYKS